MRELMQALRELARELVGLGVESTGYAAKEIGWTLEAMDERALREARGERGVKLSQHPQYKRPSKQERQAMRDFQGNPRGVVHFE